MFRDICRVRYIPPGFPRVSGDVPIVMGVIQSAMEFSPRERGCSVTV